MKLRLLSLIVCVLWCILAVQLQSVETSGSSPVPGISKEPNYSSLEDFAYDQLPEIGPHHRRITEIVPGLNEYGEAMLKTNSYIALETAMNYLHEGEWRTSQEIIELSRDGSAIAKKGHIKVKFAANINTDGAIEITDSANRKLRNHLMGLMYFDRSSGSSVIIASVQNSIGEILPPNQIIYRDVFKEVNADVVFTYRKSSIEADIVLLENLKSPSQFGLSNDSSQLQAITAFLDNLEPRKISRIVSRVENQDNRNAMAEPDVVDESLDFGEMHMIPGKCFAVDAINRESFFSRSSWEAPVAKQFKRVNGMDYLIESVEYKNLKDDLMKLPGSAANHTGAPVKSLELALAKLCGNRITGVQGGQVKVAHSPVTPSQGVVLDYILVNAATNFVFSSGTTYYVAGLFTLGGNTIFQGGSVIKFRPEGPNKDGGTIIINGTVSCLTSATNFCHFTARDDDSLGERISSSTGWPAGYYGATYLCIYSDIASTDLRHLLMRYGRTAVYYQGNNPSLLQIFHDSRIENCFYGVYNVNATVNLFNANLCGVVNTSYTQSGPPVTTSNLSYDCSVVPVATPTITPPGGTLYGPTNVVLQSISGTPVYYTLNGTVPTASSTPYSSPISISADCTLKAKAIVSGSRTSGVAAAVFSTRRQVAAPVITPSSGTYNNTISVALNSPTAGASIYYSLDGTEPRNDSYTSYYYSGSFELSYLTGSSVTVKARAYYGSLTPSAVCTVTYNLGPPISLSEAVDNLAYNFYCPFSQRWVGQSAVWLYGGDAAQNLPIENGEATSFITTLTGPGTLSFKWAVSSESGYDGLRFRYDYPEMARISGEQSWRSFICYVEPGSHTLWWEYEKDGSQQSGADAGWVDYVQFTPYGSSISLAQALDNGNLNLITGGASPWMGLEIPACYGGNAAQCGKIGANQSTYMQTTITVSTATTYCFLWKVSCEVVLDKLVFTLDGVEQDRISGEQDWTRYSFNLSPGTHTLRWEYFKNDMLSNGADLAWVDLFQNADADNDGMDDQWEQRYFGNTNQNASTDFDGDGVGDLAEYQVGTNPTIGGNLEILTPLRD